MTPVAGAGLVSNPLRRTQAPDVVPPGGQSRPFIFSTPLGFTCPLTVLTLQWQGRVGADHRAGAGKLGLGSLGEKPLRGAGGGVRTHSGRRQSPGFTDAETWFAFRLRLTSAVPIRQVPLRSLEVGEGAPALTRGLALSSWITAARAVVSHERFSLASLVTGLSGQPPGTFMS